MSVVGFAGMTHLGLVSAAAAARRGHTVYAYDADRALCDRLREGEPPVIEPGLPELLAANRERLSFGSAAERLAGCDVVYIAADVPTDDEARSDLAPIRELIDRVLPHLHETAILVVLCQVPPGFTRSLESLPHRRLIYQVETLVFGQAVDRALNPERIIVGCADPALPLPVGYREFIESYGCPILPMRYESAELAKISINFCLVASITVANTLAELSEAIGADWSEIVPALRLDRRIGQYAYLSPGLGIAGGNLERDLRTVLNLAETAGSDAGVVTAWLANSRRRRDWCWEVLRSQVLPRMPSARIAVLGLAYKENTHSTKNSPSLALLEHLADREVRVHDPVVPASVAPFATGCPDPLNCVAAADVVLVMTPWPQYRALQIADVARAMRGRILIDPFRVFSAQNAAAAGLSYYTLGMPPLLPG